MVVATDCAATTYRDSTTVVVIEMSSEGFISPDRWLTFDGEMQTMDDALTQKDGCAVVAVARHM